MKQHLVRLMLLSAVLSGLLLLLTGCPGGGGSSSAGNPGQTGQCANFAGTWTTTEQVTGNCPSNNPRTDYNTYTVTQNGCTVTVVDQDSNSYSGSANGNTLTWTGSYLDYGGTVTITNFSVGISGDSFSGSASWTWSDGSFSCSGSTAVTGSRANTPPVADAGPDQPNAVTETTVTLDGSGSSDAENSPLSYAWSFTQKPAGSTAVLSNAATAYPSFVPDFAGTYIVGLVVNDGSLDSLQDTVSITAAAQTGGGGFTLTVNAGTGGTVTKDPDLASYTSGAVVTLTAIPNQGYAFSGWSGSLTGSANPATVTMNADKTITASFAADSFLLTVNKSGNGSGTVTGTGINCGADCSQSFSSGTSVTLNAAADSGSSFSGWSGCDSTSGTQCTVAMNQAKTVVASFSAVISTTITITGLPTTAGTGVAYVLQWTTSGLAATPWTVQEDSDTSFSSPTTYLSYDTSSPYTYSFTKTTAGTYCYRVGLSPSGPFSEPRCITVTAPTSAVLRILNNTHYYMVDIRLNNVQQVSYPSAIVAGGSYDFTFTGSGTVSYNLGVGFYDSNGYPDLWFIYSGSTSVTAGQTTTLTVSNPTIGQLLSNFSPSGRDWVGQYWCYSCNPIVGYAKYHFGLNGSWSFYDNNVLQTSGTTQLVSWPDYSSVVTFRVCSTCGNIQIWYPFGTFMYQNGPPDWPTIEYIGQ